MTSYEQIRAFFNSQEFDSALKSFFDEGAVVETKPKTKPKAVPKPKPKTSESTTHTVQIEGQSFEITEASSGEKHKCDFVMKKGKNAGNECGKGARFMFEEKWYHGTLKDGVPSAHLKSALNAEKPKTVTKKPKTKADAKRLADERSESLFDKVTENKKNKSAKKPDKLKFTMNKQYKVYYDPVSKLVVDRKTRKIVGVLDVETGDIGKLTQENVQFCEARNLNFDRDNVAEDEVEEIEEEIEEEFEEIGEEDEEIEEIGEEDEEIEEIEEEIEDEEIEEEDEEIELSDDE